MPGSMLGLLLGIQILGVWLHIRQLRELAALLRLAGS
jgi:hypothetical protein